MSTCSVSRSYLIVDATRFSKTSSRLSLEDPLTLGPPAHDTTLPPEIWLKIFDFIAHIPGAFTILDGRAIEAYSEDNDGIILHDLYHEAMRAKLAISRVSRTWRRLVLPLLFEYVMIRSGRHARVLANTLALSKLDLGEDLYYGHWVKRVEVFLQDHYWELESIDALASVLRHAPNVLVFSDFFSTGRLPGYATRGIVKMLRTLCENGHLRRIESCGAIAFRLHRLLCGTPSLEVLLTKQLSLHSISLPKLRTLVIGKTDTVFAYELKNLKAPNLRSLIMHNNVLDPSSGYSPTHTSNLYPNLMHLRCLRSDEKLSLFHIADTPGLTSLTLDFGRRPPLENLEKFRIKHRTLERIDLVRFPAFSSRAGSSSDLEERTFVSTFLHSLLKSENNPSLRTIGFLRPRGYFDSDEFTRHINTREQALNDGFWENFMALCKAREVNLEASVGVHDHFAGIWQPFHMDLLPPRHPIN